MRFMNLVTSFVIAAWLFPHTASAQTPVKEEHLKSLQAAYNLLTLGKLDRASEGYRNIRLQADAPDFLKKAAFEGEAIVAIKKLSKQNDSSLSFIREKWKESVETLHRDYPSETSAYFMALIESGTDLTEDSLKATRHGADYLRLKERADILGQTPFGKEQSSEPDAETKVSTPPKEKLQVPKGATAVSKIERFSPRAYFSKSVVNIRSKPSASAEKFGSIPAKTRIRIDGRTNVNGRTWLKLAGKNQYVAGGFFITEAQYRREQAKLNKQKPEATAKPKAISTKSNKKPAPTTAPKENLCAGRPTIRSYVVKNNRTIVLRNFSGRVIKEIPSGKRLPVLGTHRETDGWIVSPSRGSCGYVSSDQKRWLRLVK